MMKNTIQIIGRQAVPELYERYSCKNDVFFLEINGRDIVDWKTYADFITEKMLFPITNPYNKNSYLDWIRDLSWFDKKEYVLVIDHHKEFMRNDPENKDDVLEMFRDIVLPWWQGDVEKYVVGGKAKPFNIYLVD